MKEFIPLYQTILWVLFLLGVIIYLRKEIHIFLEILAERIKSGSTFKIGPVEISELQKKIKKVEKDVENTNDRVSQLFLATMAESMYFNLRKLCSGKFGSYEMSKGLERELYHLRNLGYIKVESVQAIPSKGDDLSLYVEATFEGNQFVYLREGQNLKIIKQDNV